MLQVNTVGPDFFETFGVPHPERTRHRRVRSPVGAAGRGRQREHGAVTTSRASIRSAGAWTWAGAAPADRSRLSASPAMSGTRICGRPARRIVYVSAFQREAEEQNVFAIRTAGDPANWIQSAQREIQAVVPAILTTDVKTLVRPA